MRDGVQQAFAHGRAAARCYTAADSRGFRMIVSHAHRFIFVAIPKTGTHSVRQALREHMAEGDLEQVGLFVNKRFPWPELAALHHGHLSLTQVRPFLGEDAFARYFKFAFVRNPFDRFVSYCSFMTRDSDAFQQNPRAVMHHVLFTLRPVQHLLFQPQYLLLTDDDGRLLADDLGRVEDMQGSFDRVCERIGVPSRALDRVNSSRRGDYRQYYDQKLIDGVGELYARDLELFGYTF